MVSGIYSYHADIGWFKCSDLDTSKTIDLDRASFVTISGTVRFYPFT